MKSILRRGKIGWVSLAASLLLAASLSAAAPQAADNSKSNKGDASKGAITADSQKNNSGDEGITKEIRVAIVKDKSLSTYAHNVKIVTQGGKVTLKGPVRSDDEKANIGAKAAAVAGADNVTNDITVAPSKQ